MNFKLMSSDELRQMREEIITEVSDILTKKGYDKSAQNLLKATEVCQKLRCSHGTLFNLRRNGVLRAVKVGGTYLYSVEQIDSVLNEQE